ncbi:MAG: hypothetical protein KatS3mg030_428 [Saprospiraceae bacterium]|nr:MAG: hypothetical protein KatS3mg030_428 [Saprospiraceae bacterium]
MHQPLFKSLRVVELASVLAGPAAGMFFAELGAEVIKIENKRTGGDVTRQWKVPEEDPQSPFSAYWCSVNWGKEIRLYDLESEEDRQETLQLIEGADIVISNFQASSARKLGMDVNTLRSRNPRLIVGLITGFPDGDPRPAYDVVLQAESGFLSMNGEPGRPPVKLPVALIDLLAAHQLKEGLLLALWNRTHTGKGCTVEVSLFEAAVASLANQATNWLMAGHLPQRLGTLHPNIAPYGESFTCSDGVRIVLAVGNDRQFEKLCMVIGCPELAQAQQFRSNADRVANRQALFDLLDARMRSLPGEPLLEQLISAGVPAGRVRNVAEVFELAAARRMILEDKLFDGNTGKRVRTVAFRLLP